MLKVLRKIVLSVLLLLLAAIMFGCGNKDEAYNASNENRIILRLAETQSATYPSSQGVAEFARLVKEKSDGRIMVKVYESGKLGDEDSVVEQVQFGGIDLARVSVASLAKYSPKANLLTLPYLFRDSNHMWKVLDGPGGENIKKSLLKENITCLSWYEGGARGFYNAKRKINNIEDLKGLKLRVQQSQMIMDVYSSMGISLISTKSGDLYSALQTGAIDGGEDNLIAYYTSKQYEVAKYFMYDEHGRIPEVIIGSRVTMLQLPKKDQAIIEQAAQESAVVQRQLWFKMERKVLKVLQDSGVHIDYADKQSREKFLMQFKPLYNHLASDELDAIMKE